MRLVIHRRYPRIMVIMSNMGNRHLERILKTEFKARCQATNAVCWRCRQPIDYRARPQTPCAFEIDHRYPVRTHPHLQYESSLFEASHSKCNRSRGSRPAPTGEWVRADWG
jgi:hypothetical protein